MDPLNTLLTAADAARLLNLSERQIFGLAQRGAFSKSERGRYKVGEVVAGYLKTVFAEQERQKGGAAETEFRKLRSAEMQARLDERTSRLKAEAEASALTLIDESLGTVRAALFAVPARSTQNIALRATIEKEINDALTAASKTIAGPGSVATKSGGNPTAKTRKSPGPVGRGKPKVPAVKRKARSA